MWLLLPVRRQQLPNLPAVPVVGQGALAVVVLAAPLVAVVHQSWRPSMRIMMG